MTQIQNSRQLVSQCAVFKGETICVPIFLQRSDKTDTLVSVIGFWNLRFI